MDVPSVIVSELPFGVFENMNYYKNAKSQLKYFIKSDLSYSSHYDFERIGINLFANLLNNLNPEA